MKIINDFGFAIGFVIFLLGYLSYHGVDIQVLLILFSVILITFSAFIFAYYYDPNDKNNDKWYKNIITKLTGNVETPEVMNDMINSLRISMSQTNESNKLIISLKKRIRNDSIECINAAKLGLLKYIIICLEDVLPNDIRMNNGLDIINQILHNDKAKAEALKNNDDVKEIIDKLISITKTFMHKTIPKKEEHSTLFDDQNEQNSQENINYDKNIFENFGYKFIIALGLITVDSTIGQTCVGDKGGISLILTCLKEFHKESHAVTKWCFWALFHITLQNPPNKREFVFKDGISLVLKSLKVNSNVKDINQQGIALLCNILSDDPYSKMNLNDARQVALENEIVDILQVAQKTFRNVDDIQATSKFILNILISNWQM